MINCKMDEEHRPQKSPDVIQQKLYEFILFYFSGVTSFLVFWKTGSAPPVLRLRRELLFKNICQLRVAEILLSRRFLIKHLFKILLKSARFDLKFRRRYKHRSRFPFQSGKFSIKYHDVSVGASFLRLRNG